MTTREKQAWSSLLRGASGAKRGRYCQPRGTKPAPAWYERQPAPAPKVPAASPRPEWDRLTAEAESARKRRLAPDYYSPKARQAPRVRDGRREDERG